MTANIRLNHYLTELPSDNAISLNRKALLYSIAEKTAWVAFTAIAAFVFFSSFASPALTGIAALGVIALSFSILFLAWGAMVCRDASFKASEQATIETAVAKELEAIKDWKQNEVKEFVKKEIDPTPLKQLNAQEPLCALKPVIARINYLEKTAKKIQEIAFNALKASENKPQTPGQAEVKFLSRKIAAYELEYKAYPLLFEAAVLRKVLEDPTKERSVRDYGKLVQKSHGRRLSDRAHLNNDDYFVLHSGDSLYFASLRNEDSFSLAKKLG